MFVIAFVWIAEVIVMTAMGVYSTVIIQDNYIWSEVQLLVTAPITAGIFTWMLKNAGQHIVKAMNNETVDEDFPNDDIEENLEYE